MLLIDCTIEESRFSRNFLFYTANQYTYKIYRTTNEGFKMQNLHFLTLSSLDIHFLYILVLHKFLTKNKNILKTHLCLKEKRMWVLYLNPLNISFICHFECQEGMSNGASELPRKEIRRCHWTIGPRRAPNFTAITPWSETVAFLSWNDPPYDFQVDN